MSTPTPPTKIDTRYFIVHPKCYEEVSEDGNSYEIEASAVYGDLVLAGYPITKDDALGGDYIDISVTGARATVYTAHPAAEWDMGPLSALFILAVPGLGERS